MRKIILILLCVVVLASWGTIKPFFYKCLPISFQTKEMVFAQIRDITHPTVQDYALLQRYLEKGNRKELAHMDRSKVRGYRYQFMGETKDELPESGVIHINHSGESKENCILVYASYNKQYIKGLHRLIQHLKESDFKGDILYKIGGWPNLEEGDLTLAPVGYAFKVCFFREAKRLGYQRALWLDTSILPLVSLNPFFDGMRSTGYFVMGNSNKVGPYFNPLSARSLGVTLEESHQILSCSAGLFGLDFSHPIGLQVFHDWYQAAHDPYAFFSERWDQNALSVILYKRGLSATVPIETLAHGQERISSDSLFLIERDFVTKKTPKKLEKKLD